MHVSHGYCLLALHVFIINNKGIPSHMQQMQKQQQTYIICKITAQIHLSTAGCQCMLHIYVHSYCVNIGIHRAYTQLPDNYLMRRVIEDVQWSKSSPLTLFWDETAGEWKDLDLWRGAGCTDTWWDQISSFHVKHIFNVIPTLVFIALGICSRSWCSNPLCPYF